MSKIRFSLIIVVLLFIQTAVFAVPAKPGLITMYQADGTEIKVQIIGDEHFHYYLSEDNYLLINEDNNFYYGNVDSQGNLVKSTMKAEPVSTRSAEARQFLSSVNMDKVLSALEKRNNDVRMNSPRRNNPGLFDYSFPVKGDVKGLVVLVQYKDVKFKTSYDAADYFNRMMNERGFSDYGGTGCVEEYFEQQSMNAFRPHFDVYGPITLSQNMSYYGGNDWAGNDQYAWKMPIEACQQLDAEVDFSEYDTNNDGYIDNIFVFYAGQGEASGGAANTVWPHSWNISSATGTPYYFDGKRLDRYACSNEWESGKPDGVGTFIHEFSHVMGLPDLYATSYTSAFTPGAWSVMDYGPYNNDGRTPPAYSVYERYSLDWIDPIVLNGPNTVGLSYIGNSNKGCIIKTEKDNEFFLLENRQKKGWDTYIPGHGMLVWHIDYNESVWNSNTVNNTASHQYVDLEEADGSQSEYNRAGDAFPGTSNKTSFTDDTTPSMKTWAGKRLNLPITNITEINGEIKFDVAGGRPEVPAPEAVEPLSVNPESFKAAWKKSEGAAKYLLSVYTKVGEGDKQARSYILNRLDVSEDMIAEGDNLLTYLVGGLQPATQYYYEVIANDGEWDSEPSNEVAVMTVDPSFENLTPALLPVTDVTDNSFTVHWEKLEEAETYEIQLFKVLRSEPEEDICDFTGGLSNLPEGWTTSSKLTYANDAYSGASKPALRLSTADSYIASPIDGHVDYLEFWHRGSSVPEANRLNVYATEDGATWKLMTKFPINNEMGGETLTVDSLPFNTRAVKIEYQMNESKGAVAIDDIKIGRYTQVTMEPSGIFTVDSEEENDGLFAFTVKELNPYTWYSFILSGINSEGAYSHGAGYVYVMTAKASQKPDDPNGPSTGISLATVDSGTMVVTDLTGRVLYNGKSVDINRLNLKSHGIYIIRCGNTTSKIHL